jgi:hypothetical protein
MTAGWMAARGWRLYECGTSTLDSCYRQMLTPERKWRGPPAVDPHRLRKLIDFLRPERPRRNTFRSFATAEAIVYLQELFSQDEERSQGGVQTVDEGQAAHELQSPGEERSAGEPQAEVQSVDEGQAAHELLYFH